MTLLPKVSTQEQELLFFVHECQSQGFSPTIAQLRIGLGYLSNSSIQFHLKSLRRKGYLEVGNGQARHTKFKQKIGNIPIVGKCN